MRLSPRLPLAMALCMSLLLPIPTAVASSSAVRYRVWTDDPASIGLRFATGVGKGFDDVFVSAEEPWVFDGQFSDLSATGVNASLKPPFGTTIHCEYSVNGAVVHHRQKTYEVNAGGTGPKNVTCGENYV